MMKNFCYQIGSLILIMPMLIGAAADDEKDKKEVPFIVDHIVNRGTDNDIEVFLAGCLNEETGEYDVFRELTLAAPEKKIIGLGKPGQEKFINWLIPSAKDNSRSRAITHHSTVYPYRHENAIYLARRKESKNVSDSLPCIEIPKELLEKASAIHFIWSISTKGEHTFTEISPEGESIIVPAKKKSGRHLHMGVCRKKQSAYSEYSFDDGRFPSDAINHVQQYAPPAPGFVSAVLPSYPNYSAPNGYEHQ